MFEPLARMLDKHGDTFAEHLSTIAGRLGEIAGNTRAQLAQNERMRKSLSVKKKANGKCDLRNGSGYGWVVKWAASDQPVKVYLGVEGSSGFLWENSAAARGEAVDWYLPPNGMLLVFNTTEEETALNLEVEVLMMSAAEGVTGHSGEQMERYRRADEQPNADPLA